MKFLAIVEIRLIALFSLLAFVDFLFGVTRCVYTKEKLISKKGKIGVLVKMCELITIILLFAVNHLLVEVNLELLTYGGVFGLCAYETLSIYENLKAMGINVEVLKKLSEIFSKKGK